MGHSSETHKMFLNQSLELMQASFTLSQCVKRCQQDCTRDGSLTLIRKNSRLDIIDLSVLKNCGSVTGGKISKPMTRSKIRSELIFSTKSVFLQTPF